MKKYVLLLLLCCFSVFVSAQDTLFMKSGEVIKAKIIEVNETNVSYKKTSYPEGPTFIVAKNKIAKIVYGDGSVDTFHDAPSNTPAPRSYDADGYGRNIFAFNPFAFVGGNIAFSYERLNAKGKFGYRTVAYIPVADSPGNKAGGHFDFKIYLGKNPQAKYFLGPTLAGYAALHGYFNIGLMFNNGVSFQPFKAFNISIDAAGGIGHSDAIQSIPYINGFIWRAGINFGLRF
jgi:hypothetical protein